MMDSLLLYKILKNRTGAEISASGNPATLSGTLKNNPMNEMKVYGWSKQETTTGAQLFPTITPSAEAKSGITVEYMEHGKIHISGTAEKTVDFMTPTFELSAGTYTLSVGINIDIVLMRCTLSTIDGVPICDIRNGSSISETIEERKKLYLLLRVYSGKTIDLTIQPMLNASTSPLPWEPYTDGKPSPSPEYPQEIVSAGMKWSTGAQLYDMDTRLNVDGIEYEKNGTSYTINIVKMSGNLLYGVPFQFSKEDVDATLSVSQFSNLERANVRINLMDSESNVVGTLWANKTEKELSAKCSKIRFDWSSGGKFIVSDLMLNFGNTALPYEPYTDGVPKLYGDKVGLEVHGKNLVNIPDSEFTGIKLIPITLKKGTYWFMADIKPNKSNKGSIMFRKNEEEKAFFDLEQKNGSLKEITLTEDVDEIIMYSGMGYVDSIDKEGVYKNIMISADKPTTYEPYHEPQSLSISTPAGLPAIPVDSGGNYTDASGQQWIADYVDLKRGKYVKNVNTCVIDASTNVFKIGREGIYWNLPAESLPGILKGIGVGSKYPIFPSNYFERRTFNANTAYSMLYTDGDSMKGLFNSIEELNTFCKERYDAGDPVEVYYVADPIERDLTASEIQAYKNLVTYAGTTIVENDAECYMEVSAGGGDSLRAKKLALILGD